MTKMLMELREERIKNLIKDVSDLYGGNGVKIDDEDAYFLEEYIAAVVNQWSNSPKEQKEAIACFTEIREQALLLGKKLPERNHGWYRKYQNAQEAQPIK